ncbi:MAG: hypothetical protein R3E02_10095 [Blastomonas sp.]
MSDVEAFLVLVWAAVSLALHWLTGGSYDRDWREQLLRWSIVLFWWFWIAIAPILLLCGTIDRCIRDQLP